MRTSAAALELDFTEPSITAAKAVANMIAKNGSLQRDTLLWVMEQAHGGSSADGHWSLRDAYDMLELAEVLYLAKADLPADPGACLATLIKLVANLPAHTVRSEEQIELQQFSTPARSRISRHSPPASRPRTWCSNPQPAPAFSLSSRSAPALTSFSTRSMRPARRCLQQAFRVRPSRATTPS